MPVRDIARHVRQTAGVDLSHDTISRVTDGALEQMREWQHRPLEPFYPVLYIDALVAKVRDGTGVRNKAVNIAVGIDTDGAKHVLGIWVATAEAKAWAQALAQLRNRGLEEVLLRAVGDPRGAQPPAVLGHPHQHRPAAVQIHAHDLPAVIRCLHWGLPYWWRRIC